MPVEYEVDTERGRILTRLVGDVTLREVVGHLRALAEDPALPERPDLLVDLSAMTAYPDRHEVQSAAFEAERLAPKIGWQCCAIVAPVDLAFGIGRMFEMMAEPAFRATMVFRRRADAEQWLERQARELVGF
jgi:hypothetical protein